MIRVIVKTVHNIMYIIPVILVFTVYLLVHLIQGNKIDERECRRYLFNNWIIIDFTTLLFWGTIIILTIKLFPG